ncbi:MAG: hypothetical protein AABW80_01265 [Nanoarchaeota archaeon]
MHQTRQEVSTFIPIKRKGTKYIARASSDVNNAVPVVLAVRDMLKLAGTAREVKSMIHRKLLKINHGEVKDFKESIKLFNIFEADKKYVLSVEPTKKFSLKETNAEERICKVINKKLISKGRIQLNLHDGSNVISDKKIGVGDSVYLDKNGNIKSHVACEKGAKAFVFSGKYAGKHGTIESKKENLIVLKIDKEIKSLPMRSIIVQ